MIKKGIGSHQSANMKNDEWLTPPIIIKALGGFDLDPCAPIVRPWETATNHFTKNDNGLEKKWKGRVWCNPPYGLQANDWLKKMTEHGDGIALIFARTETKMFFKWVWNSATAVKFIEGRLFFHYVDGTKANANAGAPSVLIAYGKKNAEVLKNCTVKGKFLILNNN